MCNSSFKSNLVLLVPELLTAIVSCLPNPDLKSFRLTCKALGEEVPLHFDRVFLSANPRNIEVARAIADNEKFRKGVKEIIWDDALLAHDIVRPNEAIHLPAESPRAEDGSPTWFIQACKDNIKNLRNLKRDRKRPKIREFLPFSESWSYYETLLEQQEEVLRSGADINALTYVLERFQSLRRITITLAAHGSLDRPLYETPMIKSFPKGFNYPIPCDWPSSGPFGLYILPPWTAKKQWRGVCIITNILAGWNDHHTSELIIDVGGLETGLNCRAFDEPHE
ncbi:a29442a7-0189-467e-acc5-9ad5d1ee8f85 [Sclerotinia trifoliorum]|uniref:A29442a7-0189-467e-acc5-9ad5d1ee8f85 n=1 Tax=Sclerotinia trifoliorum TaxID=28548 RepID=A0A8H2ZJP3_9HELO|nr:a29442a7-0189-467e-acc5-9ad5d1ee8f85 [Sclerotinia trifoliorum]